MKESEIRPKELLEEYLRLSEIDAREFFFSDSRKDINCVACGSSEKKFKFEKSNFKYSECRSCGTVFQDPRPNPDLFEKFYTDSDSSNYWSDVFFPSVAESRREKIVIPKVERIINKIRERDNKVNRLIDVGAGYGIFLEEWLKKFPETDAIAIEPSSSLANSCREKGISVKEAMAENVADLDEFGDLVVCFEVLEHVYDPLSFLKVLKDKTKNGGDVLITTLCIDGFDLQILGEQSSAISPPFHINFLSIEGFRALFEQAGFKDIDIFTPGKLDVDIVRNKLELDDSIIENKLLRKLIQNES